MEGQASEFHLDEAWKRAVRRAHRAEVPDILRWEDHQLAWPAWRAELTRQLADGSYEPAPPIVVEVPKDGFSSRPIAMLSPLDHAVYEAVVGQMALALDACLGDGVRSARLKATKTGYRMLPQIKSWLGFQRAGRELYEEYQHAFMLTTDVASYFEYIDLEILTKEIGAVQGVHGSSVRLLSKILNSFQRTSDIWGLPQGPDASAILGNFYLLPVDRELARLPVRTIRFQDDLKIFSDRPQVLRRALRDVNRIMRNRHLNISVRKTKLLSGPEILDEFEDSEKDAIQYGLETGDPGAPDAVRALFDQASSETPVNARDLRFAVHRLRKLDDGYAIPWILDHLPEVPYLAPILVDYLSHHQADHPEIEARVTAYLADPDQNIYPYVEMQLVRMFARSKSVTSETRQILWGVVRDQNTERYVREHGMRCVGRHAEPGDSGLLRTMFSDSTDTPIRRALLVAITESAEADRSWLAAVGRSDPSLRATCEFLRKGAKLPEP